MKPYAVEVGFTMIVMAEDDSDAWQVAHENARDAFDDTYDPQISVYGEVNTEADLKRHNWDGLCIPYGGDGNTRLADILASIDPEPERDDKTIDMFAEG